MKNILYALLLVAGGLFLDSCSNDKDTSGPTIEIITPEVNDTVKLGSNLEMKFRFTDDYGIRYYSYDIFYETPGTVGEFEYFKEINVGGSYIEYEVPHSVFIPKKYNDSIPTVTGNYTLRVIAIDMYGNQSHVDQPLLFESVE